LSCRKPIVAENRGTFLSSSSFFLSFLGVHFILLRAFWESFEKNV
jgi:hypothetical protein